MHSETIGTIPDIRRETEGKNDQTTEILNRWLLDAYDKIHARCLAKLRRTRGDESLAGDLTQETYLKARRQIETNSRLNFESYGQFCRWLWRVTDSSISNYFVSKKNKPNVTVGMDPDLLQAHVGEHDATPERLMAVEELHRKTLERILALLTEKERQIFFFFLEGRTMQEAAQELNIPRMTAHTRMFAIKKKLKGDPDFVAFMEEQGNSLDA